MDTYKLTDETKAEIESEAEMVDFPLTHAIDNSAYLSQKALLEWGNKPCDGRIHREKVGVFMSYAHRKVCPRCWQSLLKDFEIGG